MKFITIEQIQLYLNKLNERGESPSAIKKRLRSVNKFLNWAHQKGKIDDVNFKQIDKLIANFTITTSPNVDKYEEIKPQMAKSEGKSFITTTIQKLKNKTFITGLGIQHYIGFSILLIFMALLGSGIYSQFFGNLPTPFAYPAS